MSYLKFMKILHFDNKIRLGAKKDGGYVIANLDEENPYDCYISAGVSNEESFSRDFIKKYNMTKYNSYAFDGTIDHYPHKYTKDITFIKKNISYIKDNQNADLSWLTSNFNNIFLKMDIEGDEYPWILSQSSEKMHKFKQIVIEFHGLTGNDYNVKLPLKLLCLEKLLNTHFIVHVHANNFGSVNNGIPDVIEVTYLNKNYFSDISNNYIFELNKVPLPIDDLDFPNNPEKDDISLNYFPFVN